MATISTEPTIMLAAPAPAVRKLLDRAGLTPDDIDLFEVNEAFASVVLRFRDELEVPEEQINVNGDRKSTRLTPVPNAHLVCRLLLDKNTNTPNNITYNKH